MRFGPVPVRDAVGCIVAHSVRTADLTLRKGAIVTDEHVNALLRSGVASIVVARPEAGDVEEDAASAEIAHAAAGENVLVERPSTGRSNLFARVPGVLLIDGERIDRANRLDEAVTIATLPNRKAVVPGEMIGTVKIIPFAVRRELAEAAATAAQGSIRVAAFRSHRIAVLSTMLPALKSSVLDKTMRVFDERLTTWQAPGPGRICDIRVPHEVDELAEALGRAAALDVDLIVVFGASAITDRRDVIPVAIEQAGGEVRHLGMPVDPGNLLLLGRLGRIEVIGAPGCARSPKENGFDWVMQRLLAGLEITRADIQAMGVGGLLMEIVSRPQPRVASMPDGPKVAGLVLAAGRSSRMGRNKLLEEVGGIPMVRKVAETALAAGLAPVSVVTGHEAERVEAALSGLDVRILHNPLYGEGLATSLAAGLAEVDGIADGVVVSLGDMPGVSAGTIRALVATFAANREAPAVVPTSAGERGNPVLLGRALFGKALSLAGDQGARRLVAAAGDKVVEVPVDDPSVLIDLDTPEALESFRLRTTP